MLSPNRSQPQPGAFERVVSQLRAERRQLFAMRASFAFAVAVALGFAVWVFPWVPVGMTAGDYDVRSTLGILLGVATAVVAPLFVVVWAGTFRNESLPEFLRVLFGAHQLIRNREQFHSRLNAECRRARHNRRYVFSILMIEHPVDPEVAGLSMEPEERRIAVHVRTTVRAQDVVATATSTQVWVLLRGASEHAARRVMNRLAEDVGDLECRIGAATFGVDGERPNPLLMAATERLAAIDAPAQQRAA